MTEHSREVNGLIEHAFRREAGRLLGILTRVLGPSRLDLAESILQETFLQAVQTWPYKGVPEKPAAWIMQVAKNKAIDAIRKDRLFLTDQSVLEAIPEANDVDDSRQVAFEKEIRDDQLRLMFICCHPSLPLEGQIALTLKTVFGFSVGEIARAFLAKEETVAQRLVRAKQKIKDAGLAFELPEGEELNRRLQSVLDVIYLLFNEGYSPHSGEAAIREDLCLEACRLAKIVSEHVLGTAICHALCALLHFQASRLRTRQDQAGEVLLLAEQDRSKWNQAMITEGLRWLACATAGERLSEFHLLAGIAACHVTAEAFDKTDWTRILDYYELLLQVKSSPVIELNRAVALSFVRGRKAAISEMLRIGTAPTMKDYYLFHATLADFYRSEGDTSRAIPCYLRAKELVGTEPERRFLVRRLKECGVLDTTTGGR